MEVSRQTETEQPVLRLVNQQTSVKLVTKFYTPLTSGTEVKIQ